MQLAILNASKIPLMDATEPGPFETESLFSVPTNGDFPFLENKKLGSLHVPMLRRQKYLTNEGTWSCAAPGNFNQKKRSFAEERYVLRTG